LPEFSGISGMSNQPIEVVLDDPAKQFATLYKFSRFLDKQPIVVSIPVVTGFRKAVVVAAALGFAVKLRIEQPDHALMKELDATLEFYLQDRTIQQPIEFFHSAIHALFHGNQTTLWDINEKKPPSGNLPAECTSCEYVQHCSGFFKSPRADYSCAGVKQILAKLTRAAAELKSMTARPND
jgi:hypothetical protein